MPELVQARQDREHLDVEGRVVAVSPLVIEIPEAQGFGVSGTVAYVDQDSNTLAQLSSDEVVEGASSSSENDLVFVWPFVPIRP